MTADLPIGMLLIVGGLLAAALPVRLRGAVLIALPFLAFAQLLSLAPGLTVTSQLFGIDLQIVRVDRLSLAFGYVFVIATLLNVIYSWHVRDGAEQPIAMVYAGCALGAIFAGDLLTLFLFLELSAVASVLVIWANPTDRARRAGMRYIIVQLFAGMLLLAGTALHYGETGSLQFDLIGLESAGGALILLAFGIKCAFPLLHNWLQDAYPEASATGTVVLSAFTTKLGIYALARGFPGTEELIYVGTVMAAFPIFYAVIENDLRRVLAYSLNNQLGFMVVGIGIGTDMGVNGAVAHAFADILFKGLLFMSMGAVLLRTGTVNGSELGGLYKSMPMTTGFCIVGAASISAFPLFSGFVTKSMIMVAAGEEGHWLVWLVLLFASAGVFHHAGIKIPYFAFFGHDSGRRCDEAPRNMLVAMAIAALLCVGIGSFPDALYAVLPHPVTYEPYSAGHVLAQLQLLVFSALAFAVLMRTGIYPPELRSVNLDADWFYRRLAPRLVAAIERQIRSLLAVLASVRMGALGVLGNWNRQLHGARGPLARTWPLGSMALWILVLLLALLVTGYPN